jgi:hypothetical protein
MYLKSCAEGIQLSQSEVTPCLSDHQQYAALVLLCSGEGGTFLLVPIWNKSLSSFLHSVSDRE